MKCSKRLYGFFSPQERFYFKYSMNLEVFLLLSRGRAFSYLDEVAKVEAVEQLLQGAGAAPARCVAPPSTTLADRTFHFFLHQDKLEMPDSAINTALPQTRWVLGYEVNGVSLLWNQMTGFTDKAFP